jgi:outer membrane biosynthesis protein TonB
MSCDRTGEHYFAALNHVGGRRGTSLAITVSVAISATILLLLGSEIIARAATIEEVARCRAIQIKKQQWDCFKSLKAPKQNAPKAKRDDTRQSQKEDVPKVQTADVPKVKADVPKVQTEDAPKVQAADVPKVQTENVPEVKTENVPKVKSEGPQPVPLGSLQTASDDPASTSSIDRLNVAAGQPVCVDQDALAAAFFAAVVIGARPEQIASYGCHMIPNDAQVEILQRFPSGFQFLRLVKVNVTSPSQPDSTVGYTFEISR